MKNEETLTLTFTSTETFDLENALNEACAWCEDAIVACVDADKPTHAQSLANTRDRYRELIKSIENQRCEQ